MTRLQRAGRKVRVWGWHGLGLTFVVVLGVLCLVAELGNDFNLFNAFGGQPR